MLAGKPHAVKHLGAVGIHLDRLHLDEAAANVTYETSVIISMSTKWLQGILNGTKAH